MIDIDDEFQPGDLCWLETPLNPTGEARLVDFSLADTRAQLTFPLQGYQVLCGQGAQGWGLAAR